MRVPTLARPPLPPGHTRAAAVLSELRAADTSATALGMRRPVAPLAHQLPPRDLIARLAFVSTAMHADYAKHLDTLAVLDDISAAWIDAADTHALRMALAPVEALLRTEPTDPRYGHRAFLDIDNANKLLADVRVSATHALDDTYWSVTGRVNAAAALVPPATPKAEVA